MKASDFVFVTPLLLTTWLLTASCVSPDDNGMSTKKQPRPNIVLILTDDQGYGDLGHTGNTVIDTPSLDTLFEQGVSFKRFYVSPVCSPTRASLLTGKHSLKTGVFHVTRGGEKMQSQQITLAERLKPLGYTSGLFGKWHNGLQYPHDPLGQGFDEFYGFSAGHLTQYIDGQLQHNDKSVPYTGYVADSITDKAIDFIKTHKERPFFTFLSFNTPHGPFQLPDHYFQKYKAKGLSDLDAAVYGMVENIDDNVQRVRNTLQALNIEDNTLIIFLSDNGAAFPGGVARYNAQLKGHKGLVDEGGVRTPFVMHWPKGLPKSVELTPIAQHIDLVPTLLSLLGEPLAQEQFDGKDLTPLLQNPANESSWPERYLFTHRFKIAKDSSQDPVHLGPGAIRDQTWLATLSEDNVWRLYNLQKDPSQKNDLAQSQADKLAELQAAYTQWFEETVERYGPYKTIPIELGHQGHERVELPAHEGILLDEHLIYQHGAGWSHDWISSTSQRRGDVYWPVKIVTPGQYKVTLAYATAALESSAKVDLSWGASQSSQHSLTPFVGKQISTERQYFTGEAPEMTWQEVPLGIIELTDSDDELRLTFAHGKDEEALWVKHLVLEKI